jgi:nucleoid-associated protein YgaU
VAKHRPARNRFRWIPALTLTGIAFIGGVSVSAYNSPHTTLSSSVSAPAPVPFTKPVPVIRVPQAAPQPPAVAKYTVKSGENLWDVAVKFCKNGNDWHGLLKATPGLGSNPNMISPGEEVTIDCAS